MVEGSIGPVVVEDYHPWPMFARRMFEALEGYFGVREQLIDSSPACAVKYTVYKDTDFSLAGADHG